MRSVILMIVSILLVLFGASCAHTTQERSTAQEHLINIESKLIQDGYELFAVKELGKPISEHIYLLAKSGEIQLRIQDTEAFAQIVRGITTN